MRRIEISRLTRIGRRPTMAGAVLRVRQSRGAVMSTTTVGIAQWHPVCGKPRRNLVTALTLIKSLAAQGCTLIVLPGLWASGYDAASFADDTAVAAVPLDAARRPPLSASGL